MEQMQAAYGYKITKVPEGNLVTYWKVKYPISAVFTAGWMSLILGFASLLMSAGIPLIGLLSPFLLFGPVSYLLWSNHKRGQSPDSFVIGSEDVIASGRSFPRKDISTFYIRDLTGEVAASMSSSGGGYFVGGTGAVGATMAASSAAAHAIGQTARASGANVRRAYEAVNVRIRFTFGENEFDLASGLNAPRAERMFSELEKLLDAKTT